MQERARAVAEYHGSGLTQKGFAEQAGLSVATLRNWVKRAESEPRGQEPCFWELPRIAPATGGSCKVHFPRGVVLEVPAGFPAVDLEGLVNLLRAP